MLGEDIGGGGELYNPCRIITTRANVYSLFYELEIPAGRVDPVRVLARAQDPTNFSASIQVFEAEGPALCMGPQS